MRTLALLFMTVALATAQDKLGAGSYKGTWSGAGGSGAFHMTLKPGSGGMAAEIGFTIQDQEVPCNVKSVKVDGAKLTMLYEFDLQGTPLESSIQGTLKGKTLEGTYKTTAPGSDAPVDEGTWKTAVSDFN